MRLYFLLLFCAALVFGCKNKNASSEAPAMTGDKDFDTFYMRFHRDTAYQMAHITFPLEGLPPDAANATESLESYRWQRADWQPHQLFNDPDYMRTFRNKGDLMIEETLRHKSGEFGMLRRFAKMGDDWFLIYYAAPNRLK